MGGNGVSVQVVLTVYANAKSTFAGMNVQQSLLAGMKMFERKTIEERKLCREK